MLPVWYVENKFGGKVWLCLNSSITAGNKAPRSNKADGTQGWGCGKVTGCPLFWPPVTSPAHIEIKEPGKAGKRLEDGYLTGLFNHQPPSSRFFLLLSVSSLTFVPHFTLALESASHRNGLCSTCPIWDTEECHSRLPAFPHLFFKLQII